MQKVIITFDEAGCPKRLDIDEKYIDDWNNAGLYIKCYSWNASHDINMGNAELEERTECVREVDKTVIRKIELTFDKREHLETVTIDGLKVYDQMQQTFPCPKTTFFLKCCDWGREKILQITHDFERIL